MEDLSLVQNHVAQETWQLFYNISQIKIQIFVRISRIILFSVFDSNTSFSLHHT